MGVTKEESAILFTFLTKGMAKTVSQIHSVSSALKKLVQTTREGIGLSDEQIQGIGRTKKAMANMNKVSTKSVELSNANNNALTEMFTGVSAKTAGFLRVLGMSREELEKYNKQGIKFKKTGGKVANFIRKFTHGLRGFRMEMLGVMFFGMGMKKFFMGLLRPVLEVTGVFDIFRAMLQILFLPIGLKLLEWALKVFDFFTGLSQGTKELIGKMVLFGAIIGGALFLFGMFALGIGSVILAFGFLFKILSKIAISGFIAKLAVGFLGISSAIPGVDALGGAFGGVKDKVSSVWTKIKESEAMKKLIKALGIEVEEGQKPWNALKNKIKEKIDEIRDNLGISKKDMLGWKMSLEDKIDGVKTWFLNFKNDVAEWLGADSELSRALKTNEDEWDDWQSAISKSVGKLFEKIGGMITDFMIEHKTGLTLISGFLGAAVGASTGPFAEVLAPAGAIIAAGETSKYINNLEITQNVTNNVASDVDLKLMIDDLVGEIVQKVTKLNKTRGS